MQRLLTAIVVVFIATIASAQTRSVFIEDLTSYEPVSYTHLTLPTILRV